MNRVTIALLATAAVTLASCGHKTATDTTTTNMTSVTTNDTTAMTNAATPAAAPGQTFANAAAAGDAFEVAISKLALDNASSSAVKKFASAMITAHEGSTARLKTATAALTPAITPDATLSADQQAALDGMKDKKGADFDTAYIAAQTDAHTRTLAAVKDYAATGDVPALKTFAAGLVPVVTAHLNMAKGLGS